MPKFRMILKGGIGNQLFQLSLASKLKMLYDLEVAFDISSYKNDPYARKPSLIEIFPLLGIASESLNDVRPEGVQILSDGFFGYDPLLSRIVPVMENKDAQEIILDGYWQDIDSVTSEFIEQVRCAIEEFSEKKSENYTNIKKLCADLVGIHFRRQDYKHHGLVKDSYYAATSSFLISRSNDQSFAVFADEPNSVKYFLKKLDGHYIFINSASELIDLSLFAACKSHVIANSTFSWWGARLAKRRGKVFYPIPWSLIAEQRIPQFPKDWCRIESAIEVESETFSVVNRCQVEYANYLSDEQTYLADDETREGLERMFCPGDATPSTNFNAHCVYHTAWAARRLFSHPVEQHLDIGSDLRFATIASAFQKMIFADFRPPILELTNLSTQRVDLLSLNFESESFESISCMHVVEHIGLGRYGDPINAKGSEIAILELKRILKRGGLLYFVVPVGRQRTVFHAHRIFSPKYILEFFADCTLEEFSLIDDAGAFAENIPLEVGENQDYGCGCFLIRKNTSA